nr:autophagy protein 13 [Polyrhizophydium stewartii]
MRQFNLELDDMEPLREEMRFWKQQIAGASQPPPLTIDIFLDVSEVPQSHHLVLRSAASQRRLRIGKELLSGVDSVGRPVRKSRIVLESWQLTLSCVRRPTRRTIIVRARMLIDAFTPAHGLDSQTAQSQPPDLPVVYKKSVVFFRSLYSMLRLIPAYRLCRRMRRSEAPLCSVSYRLSTSRATYPDDAGLGAISALAFLLVLNLHVAYRLECDFSVEAPETPIAHRFVELDDAFFATGKSAARRRSSRLQHGSSLGSGSPTGSGSASASALALADDTCTGASGSGVMVGRTRSGQSDGGTAPTNPIPSSRLTQALVQNKRTLSGLSVGSATHAAAGAASSGASAPSVHTMLHFPASHPLAAETQEDYAGQARSISKRQSSSSISGAPYLTSSPAYVAFTPPSDTSSVPGRTLAHQAFLESESPPFSTAPIASAARDTPPAMFAGISASPPFALTHASQLIAQERSHSQHQTPQQSPQSAQSLRPHRQPSLQEFPRSRKSLELVRRPSFTFSTSSPVLHSQDSLHSTSLGPAPPPLLFTPSSSFAHPVLQAYKMSPPALMLFNSTDVGSQPSPIDPVEFLRSMDIPGSLRITAGSGLPSIGAATGGASETGIESEMPGSAPRMGSHSLLQSSLGGSLSPASRRAKSQSALAKFKMLKESNANFTESILHSTDALGRESPLPLASTAPAHFFDEPAQSSHSPSFGLPSSRMPESQMPVRRHFYAEDFKPRGEVISEEDAESASLHRSAQGSAKDATASHASDAPHSDADVTIMAAAARTDPPPERDVIESTPLAPPATAELLATTRSYASTASRSSVSALAAALDAASNGTFSSQSEAGSDPLGALLATKSAHESSGIPRLAVAGMRSVSVVGGEDLGR